MAARWSPQEWVSQASTSSIRSRAQLAAKNSSAACATRIFRFCSCQTHKRIGCPSGRPGVDGQKAGTCRPDRLQLRPPPALQEAKPKAVEGPGGWYSYSARERLIGQTNPAAHFPRPIDRPFPTTGSNGPWGGQPSEDGPSPCGRQASAAKLISSPTQSEWPAPNTKSNRSDGLLAENNGKWGAAAGNGRQLAHRSKTAKGSIPRASSAFPSERTGKRWPGQDRSVRVERLRPRKPRPGKLTDDSDACYSRHRGSRAPEPARFREGERAKPKAHSIDGDRGFWQGKQRQGGMVVGLAAHDSAAWPVNVVGKQTPGKAPGAPATSKRFGVGS